MSERIFIPKVQPAAYEAVRELEKYLATTELTPIEKDLIKIRASQINGCAYCLNKHTADARKNGETEQRIYLINAWRETELFTLEEQAILALTEEMTLIHQKGVSDCTYQAAEKILGAGRLAQAMMVIITINSWNRMVISGSWPVSA